MTIYIDTDFKCHLAADGSLTPVETDAFDGKAPEYIEGYRFVPAGAVWTREDGTEFQGEMVAPWKPWDELDSAQREYEREQFAALKAQAADMQAALAVLGVSE